MLALAVTVLLSAAPPESVAVAVVSKRAGAEVFANKIAANVYDALATEGVSALTDEQTRARAKALKLNEPRNCAGARGCVIKLAAALGPQSVVVGVDVGKLAEQLAIRVEAVAADSSEPLAVIEVTTSTRGWSDATAAPMVQLARKLKQALRTAPVAAVVEAAPVSPRPASADAPVAERPLEPASTQSARTDLVTSGGTGGQRTAGLAVGAVGVAALVTSGVLAAVAFSGKSSLESTYTTVDGQRVSTLTRAELDARGGAVNTQFTASLAMLVVGVALAATGGALLATSP